MSNNDFIDYKAWLHNAVAKAVEQGKEEAKTLFLQGHSVALNLWIAPSTEALYGDIALSTDKPSGDDWELWFSSVVDGGTPYEYWHNRVHDAVRDAPILAYGVEHQTETTRSQPSRPKG